MKQLEIKNKLWNMASRGNKTSDIAKILNFPNNSKTAYIYISLEKYLYLK